jgi:hypothetical protein
MRQTDREAREGAISTTTNDSRTSDCGRRKFTEHKHTHRTLQLLLHMCSKLVSVKFLLMLSIKMVVDFSTWKINFTKKVRQDATVFQNFYSNLIWSATCFGRHTAHHSTLVVICVVRLLFVLLNVLLVCKCVLSPGDNPIAVNKYITLYIVSYHISCHMLPKYLQYSITSSFCDLS